MEERRVSEQERLEKIKNLARETIKMFQEQGLSYRDARATIKLMEGIIGDAVYKMECNVSLKDLTI